MNRLILASDNAHKYREFREILSGTDTEIIMRSEAGCDFKVEENGTTFAENAYIKAKSVTDFTGIPAEADDSGIFSIALRTSFAAEILTRELCQKYSRDSLSCSFSSFQAHVSSQKRSVSGLPSP